MFNKVILVGNLTRDVELRYLPSGAALARLGLATNRRYKKQDGTQAEEVCYIDANLFGRTAEVANQYLKKGSQVLIEGRLVLESWTDNTGTKRSKHSIAAENMQMLGQRQNANENVGYGESGYASGYEQQEVYQKPSPQVQRPQKEPDLPVIDINDDEIPF
ncbi:MULTISPECIES: single-stranded DNA-binding protein [unclassified Helicobacter]|uniref:single-stranded DNA-binding protein n=1 Tax=unclassified Helicobacter TaxID=2593540 RepID=UPI000DCB5D88|nr:MULTISPECIES: single-stranded DNA-binding protein [unclassified Helicobacter]MCI7766217.1 single-stranded DNA-binding protein [Helicobacter sp.]RAX52122.1 single-stranded DNA-binding protein [Helicobacter sp. 11-8110]